MPPFHAYVDMEYCFYMHLSINSWKLNISVIRQYLLIKIFISFHSPSMHNVNLHNNAQHGKGIPTSSTVAL